MHHNLRKWNPSPPRKTAAVWAWVAVMVLRGAAAADREWVVLGGEAIVPSFLVHYSWLSNLKLKVSTIAT